MMVLSKTGRSHANVIAAVTFAVLFSCAFSSPANAANRLPHFTVRITLQKGSCIPCIRSVLSRDNDGLGAINKRVHVTVESSSKKIRRDVQKVVNDSTLVSVQVCPLNGGKADVARVYQDTTLVGKFKIPEQIQLLFPFIDSLDAALSWQVVHDDAPSWKSPLKSFIELNENTAVHIHARGNAVSMAAKDRAIVATTHTAYVLPQYHASIPDSLNLLLIMPTGCTVFDTNTVVYRLFSAENPVDTVIAGKKARLYQRTRSWLCRVVRHIDSANRFNLVESQDQAFGMWANGDSSMFITPASDQPGDELPAFFSLRRYDPVLLRIGDSLQGSIPAKYYPIYTALADGTEDKLYLCSVDSGFVRIDHSGGLLRLPSLHYLQEQASLVRCVAFQETVLLTYDSGDSTLTSVLVSSVGTRLSPVFKHPRGMVFAQTALGETVGIVGYYRDKDQLCRKFIWRE